MRRAIACGTCPSASSRSCDWPFRPYHAEYVVGESEMLWQDKSPPPPPSCPDAGARPTVPAGCHPVEARRWQLLALIADDLTVKHAARLVGLNYDYARRVVHRYN